MRFIRFTLLLNSLLNKSNKSKFLKFINIGIFFSLFAISSALITFYIENKIDKLEYSLSENHIQSNNRIVRIHSINKVRTVFNYS